MRLHEYVFAMMARVVAGTAPVRRMGYEGTPLKPLGPFPSGCATAEQGMIRGPKRGKGTRRQRRLARHL